MLVVVLIRGCVCYTRPVNASRLQPLSYMEAEESAGCTGNVVLYIICSLLCHNVPVVTEEYNLKVVYYTIHTQIPF